MRTVLYKKDVSDKIRVWEIEAVDLTIYIRHGVLHGAMQTKTEFVARGLGGRTLEEQVKSRYLSRINDQYKNGYKDSVQEARDSAGTNGIGLLKPMLAHPIKNVNNISFEDAWVQHKMDGHRCLITRRGGENIAYSRQGKVIPSISHITDTIELEEGDTIDGELYCHGVSLQTITSWIKREQEGTVNLNYHAYDMVINKPFSERFIELGHRLMMSDSANLVHTVRVNNFDDIQDAFKASRIMGYEGTILRWGSFGYEVGKRSKSLVKIKEFHDAEFEVVDIIPSVDGWAILECKYKNKTFKVTAPGTFEEKERTLRERDKFIGKYVTCEYANLTKDGVPFHCIAKRWREDI